MTQASRIRQLSDCLGPVHVFHIDQAEPDGVASLHKRRHHYLDAVAQPGGLPGGIRLAMRRRRGIGNLHFDEFGKLNAHRLPLYRFDRELHARIEKFCLFSDESHGHFELIVRDRIHEDARAGIAIQKFECLAIHRNIFDLQIGSKAMLPTRSGGEILQPHVIDPAHFSLPRMIVSGEHLVELAFKTNRHTGPDLGGVDHSLEFTAKYAYLRGSPESQIPPLAYARGSEAARNS